MFSIGGIVQNNKPKRLTKKEQQRIDEQNRLSLMRSSAPCVVKFVLPKGAKASDYPFQEGEHYLFMAEITNMPGHCVISDNCRVYWGYHTDSFYMINPEDE